MQRKPTKNTRGPNAEEKRFQSFVKSMPCVWCDNDGPSIVDHVRGSTFKHNKTLIGHWFVVPNCQECDHKKTIKGEKLGDYADAWLSMAVLFEALEDGVLDVKVMDAIEDWGKGWQNGG